jgi:hypothetical protein
MNSNDTTAGISRDTLKRLSACGEIIDENRQGKGNPVRRAFMDVDADIILHGTVFMLGKLSCQFTHLVITRAVGSMIDVTV